MKLAFIASSGGHLEELARLAVVAEKHESFVVTEESGVQEGPPLHWAKKSYYLRQINRKSPLFLFQFILLFSRSWRIMRNENPDCIISTGALITYPLCVIGKLKHKKIIYIESFARVDHPSLTGRLMVRLADLFIVQWEEMCRFYPKALYAGGIF